MNLREMPKWQGCSLKPSISGYILKNMCVSADVQAEIEYHHTRWKLIPSQSTSGWPCKRYILFAKTEPCSGHRTPDGMINSSKTEIVPCSVLKDDDFAIFMAPWPKLSRWGDRNSALCAGAKPDWRVEINFPVSMPDGAEQVAYLICSFDAPYLICRLE